MKVRGRERVGFNFIGLAKSFFGNGTSGIDEEDKATQQEVAEIIKHQNSDFIKGLEKAVEYTESNKSQKKNSKIDIKKATPIKRLDKNSIENKQIEEEKERE